MAPPIVPEPPRTTQREALAESCTTRLRDVAGDTLRTVCGNARAAAIDMRIHEGHLSRSLKDGTLRLEQLEALGPAFAAKFGANLTEAFGRCDDPKARLQRTIRAFRRLLEALEEDAA
jgi:hypothetical protein